MDHRYAVHQEDSVRLRKTRPGSGALDLAADQTWLLELDSRGSMHPKTGSDCLFRSMNSPEPIPLSG